MSLEDGDVQVEGEYHILEEDGARIFLPKVFKRYSMAEYQQVLKKLLSEADYKLNLAQLDQKRSLAGNLYIYFDEESRSTCSVNATTFTPLTKEDAKQLLGYMRIGNERKLSFDEEYTKVTAKYSGIPENYTFKSVYRIYNNKTKLEYFTSLYIVTRNNKTVMYHLLTGAPVYFDPFVNKIEL